MDKKIIHAMIGLFVILLGAGFYSEPWLKLIESSLDGLNAIYGQHDA